MEQDRSRQMGESSEWTDLTLSMEQVVHRASHWLPVMVALTFIPYLIAWGLPEFPEWPGLSKFIAGLVVGSVVIIVVYAVSALLHEALHVAAMIVVGGVPPSSLHFGMRLSEGVLYVHSSRAMSARAYRIVLITPAILLGIVPAVAGTLYGRGWLVAYGFVMLASAIGDFAVLQLMRHVDARTPVRDHPEDIGCIVRISPPSS